jgi:WD40 repeat protein
VQDRPRLSYVMQGDAWIAVFNKQVSRRLQVSLVHTLRHTARIRTVQFSPDGKYLALFANGTLKLFDVQTGARVSTFSQSSTKIMTLSISNILFTTDGRYLVGDSLQDQAVIIWDIETGESQTLKLEQDKDYAVAAFSLDRKLMVTRNADGAVRLWHLEIGASIRASATSFQDSPVAYANDLSNSLAVSPDKKLVASGAYEAADIWDTETGFLVTQLEGGSGRVDSLAFSSTGSTSRKMEK